MTVTHVGSSEQYASGWESIFAKSAKKSTAPAKKAPAKSAKKAPAKKKKKK